MGLIHLVGNNRKGFIWGYNPHNLWTYFHLFLYWCIIWMMGYFCLLTWFFGQQHHNCRNVLGACLFQRLSRHLQRRRRPLPPARCPPCLSPCPHQVWAHCYGRRRTAMHLTSTTLSFHTRWPQQHGWKSYNIRRSRPLAGASSMWKPHKNWGALWVLPENDPQYSLLCSFTIEERWVRVCSTGSV